MADALLYSCTLQPVAINSSVAMDAINRADVNLAAGAVLVVDAAGAGGVAARVVVPRAAAADQLTTTIISTQVRMCSASVVGP